MLAVLLLVLVTGATNLKAQERTGLPMWEGRRTHSEAVLWMQQGCPERRGFYATCEELLRQYRENDPQGAPTSVSGLATYVASLMEVDCPPEMRLAWLQITRNVRVLHYQAGDASRRKAWEGEKCLYNPITGRYVLSLWCGNGITYPQSAAQPIDQPREMSLMDAREIKDTNRITVPKGTRIRGDINLVLDSSMVITMREPTALVVTTVDTTSLPAIKDSIRASVVDSVRIEGPRIGNRLITRSDTLNASRSVIIVDVKQKKSGGLWRYVRWPLAILAGGVIYELIDDDDCGCTSPKTGGPQNPPN